MKVQSFLIPPGSSYSSRSSYYDYKLAMSKKYIHLMLHIVCLFNLLLLIPDLTLNPDLSIRIWIVVLRVSFSVILLAAGIVLWRIEKFSTFTLLITGLELFATALFLFTMGQYEKPDFMIQAMGMMIIIIAVYQIPNKWENMLFTVALGSVSFFLDTSMLIKTVSKTEFAAAAVYIFITILLGAIASKNAELHQFREFEAKSQLEHISLTDCLTETANRYKLKEEAKRWIDFCHRQAFPLSLVFIDVDNLKTINDRYGHSMGDSVLSDLAKLITKQLRSSDTLARWGGDEFVLLLPNVPVDRAVYLIERIRNSIQDHPVSLEFDVTCSFGIAEMNLDDNFESLVEKADQLMYQSKKQGKDRVQWDKVRQDCTQRI